MQKSYIILTTVILFLGGLNSCVKAKDAISQVNAVSGTDINSSNLPIYTLTELQNDPTNLPVNTLIQLVTQDNFVVASGYIGEDKKIHLNGSFQTENWKDWANGAKKILGQVLCYPFEKGAELSGYYVPPTPPGVEGAYCVVWVLATMAAPLE
jgi:hypothetical protein